MKTINVHVGELLSPLGALGVEKQLMRFDGVTGAAVNPVSGCATVTYDEARISASAIEEAIESAKTFCGSDAPAFVNGVLGAVLRPERR